MKRTPMSTAAAAGHMVPPPLRACLASPRAQPPLPGLLAPLGWTCTPSPQEGSGARRDRSSYLRPVISASRSLGLCSACRKPPWASAFSLPVFMRAIPSVQKPLPSHSSKLQIPITPSVNPPCPPQAWMRGPFRVLLFLSALIGGDAVCALLSRFSHCLGFVSPAPEEKHTKVKDTGPGNSLSRSKSWPL